MLEKNVARYLLYRLIVIFVVVIFLADVANAFSLFGNIERLTLLVRAAALGFVFLYIFLSKSKYVDDIVLLILISVLFALTNIQTIEYGIGVYIDSLIFGFKFLALIIYSLFFSTLSRSDSKFLCKILMCIGFSYCVFIVIGAVFEIVELKNYGTSGRYGYKGVIEAGNEALAVVFTVAFLFVYDFFYKRTILSFLAMAIALCALMLTGTKSVLIVFIFLTLFVYTKLSLTMFFGLFTLIFIILTVFVIREGYFNEMPATLEYFKYQYENVARGDLVTLISSGRDYKLKVAYEYFISDNPVLILIGGFPTGLYQIELDFVDMYFSFGLIPFLMLFYLYCKHIFILTGEGKDYRYFASCLFLIAFFAGHVISSGAASVFIASVKYSSLMYRKEAS